MDNPADRTIVRPMTARDILIVGGGLNGSALALALAQAGLGATLIDPTPESVHRRTDFDGRGYALSAGSRRMLEALGLWGQVADHAQPILDIRVSDGHAGDGAWPGTLHFDHAEIEDGPMGHVVEDRHLRGAFLDALEGAERITRIEDSVTSQSVEGAEVVLALADGTALPGVLAVGSDGRSSGTAARAGIRRRGWDYGQTALVCAIAHERPHEGCAHQFFMPEGPLAVLPLPGNRSSIVWTERTARAAKIAAMEDDAYLTVLRPRFGDFLGEIGLEGERFSYPLSLSLAQSFTAPRVALVGDAAHGVHPIAGQGLNAGLKDVAALAQVLVEAARRGEDPGAPDVLARYQQWRRFDTATLALATDGFNRLFSNDNPLLRLGRDLGMGLVGKVPALRRGLIREAAGLTGDLPDLMRGLPL